MKVVLVRNKWGFFILNLLAAGLLFSLLAPVYNLIAFIDILFYLCFFYLFVGLFLWIVKGGFFDAITYSFRRVTNRVAKNKDYLDDFEDKPLPSQMFKKKLVHFFLFQGIILLIALLILLVVYYQA
ncbi:DUF3899 domain-containing protein [Halobacillus sp. A5]|uniref:DUF3899 domain-containing protein n=1 Tax=Halobacillus sp. A5 TaxID=2880263 RepID=UPI0020A65E84|nr:DUF3899 domain-containing protein [Halobacillus sp. A5]MCP3026684.1 DUF3899 domain-containing protein [Halobacillus sp. A5]